MYVDIGTLMTIATGQPLPAAVVQQIRDNEEFFIDPPACSIKEATAQSIPNNTLTVLASDEENFDNDSMHSTTTNTSRVTIQTAGRYLITCNVTFATNATGERLVDILKNGTTAPIGGGFQIDAVAASTTNMTFTQTLTLSAADYIECRVRQTSGGALNCTLVEFAALFVTR